jgi:hypothetical protein
MRRCLLSGREPIRTIGLRADCYAATFPAA